MLRQAHHLELDRLHPCYITAAVLELCYATVPPCVCADFFPACKRQKLHLGGEAKLVIPHQARLLPGGSFQAGHTPRTAPHQQHDPPGQGGVGMAGDDPPLEPPTLFHSQGPLGCERALCCADLVPAHLGLSHAAGGRCRAFAADDDGAQMSAIYWAFWPLGSGCEDLMCCADLDLVHCRAGAESSMPLTLSIYSKGRHHSAPPLYLHAPCKIWRNSMTASEGPHQIRTLAKDMLTL